MLKGNNTPIFKLLQYLNIIQITLRNISHKPSSAEKKNHLEYQGKCSAVSWTMFSEHSKFNSLNFREVKFMDEPGNFLATTFL